MPLGRRDIDALFARIERARIQVNGVLESSRRARAHATAVGADTREAREQRWQGRYERAVTRQEDLLRGIGLDQDAD